MAELTSGMVDRPVTVTSVHGKEISTTIRLHEWSTDEKTSRFFKRLGMWWGGAVIAALLPPHLMWGIIVFLCGPLAAWLASKQKAMVQPQELPCPDCGNRAAVQEQPEAWPLGARCVPCGNIFWISQAATSSEKSPDGPSVAGPA